MAPRFAAWWRGHTLGRATRSLGHPQLNRDTSMVKSRPQPVDTSGQPSPRPLRRRPPLPSARAGIGGLLVALAALGSWWTSSGANRQPTDRYLVASRALGPGHRIVADDLRTLSLPSDAAPAAHLFPDSDPPIGRVLAGPLQPGELLQRGVLASEQPPDALLTSIAIEPAWALAGSLRAGDVVDLLATFGDGLSATTTQVARSVPIVDIITKGGAGIGQESGQVLVVRFTDAADLLAAVNAARSGDLTVVRTDGQRQ